MNYCGLIKNDFTGDGVGVTLFVSGCNLHCPGCHNKEAQDFNSGQPFTSDTIKEIADAIVANNMNRNLYVMGGEPLDAANREEVASLIFDISNALPETKIYVWTGYTYEHLIKLNDSTLNWIFGHIDYIIDGPYLQE